MQSCSPPPSKVQKVDNEGAVQGESVGAILTSNPVTSSMGSIMHDLPDQPAILSSRVVGYWVDTGRE